jgi:hypothetical protein
MLKSAGIQTTLNFKGADQRKVVNGQFVLTPAEKEKLRIQSLVMQQYNTFKRNFPEMMDKNQIKYPIDDKLIIDMPELHG